MQGQQRKWKALEPTARANIRHSPIPNQINIKSHTKAYLPQFLPPDTSCPAFNNKKSQIMLTGKEKTNKPTNKTPQKLKTV